MSREPVIVAKNLGKKYWLYPTVTRRVLGCFLGPERVGASPIRVLSGLSFELYPGEAIALIGKNGAGKSTALQILAGIIPPSDGEYVTHGRVCALLELGAGFNPEFTGRQNIHIAGLLAGLSHEEICATEASIIDFAEIGEYIDQPVKFYSSGMFLRLAFAVALAGKPDIIIVDEALAVGDIFFRQKCYARLRDLRAQGMAVILVTHNMEDVTQFCDRAILLEKGKARYFDDCKEGVQHYYAIEGGHKYPTNTVDLHSVSALDRASDCALWWTHLDGVMHPALDKQISQSKKASIAAVLLTDGSDMPRNVFAQGDVLRIRVVYNIHKTLGSPVAGYTLWNDKGVAVHGKNFLHDDLDLPQCVEADGRLFCLHEVTLNIQQGEYSLNIGLAQKGIAAAPYENQREVWTLERVVDAQNVMYFSIMQPSGIRRVTSTHHGVVNLPGNQQYKIISA